MTKPYLFDSPGGRSQLIVQHFMLGPGREQGCKSCSFMMDHFDHVGEYLEVERPRLLVFTWATRDSLPETSVSSLSSRRWAGNANSR